MDRFILLLLSLLMASCHVPSDPEIYYVDSQDDESQLLISVVPSQCLANAELATAYLKGYALGAASMFRCAGKNMLIPDIIDYTSTRELRVQAHRCGYENGQEAAVAAVSKAAEREEGVQESIPSGDAP